jgi:hypothetical protein
VTDTQMTELRRRIDSVIKQFADDYHLPLEEVIEDLAFDLTDHD